MYEIEYSDIAFVLDYLNSWNLKNSPKWLRIKFTIGESSRM